MEKSFVSLQEEKGILEKEEEIQEKEIVDGLVEKDGVWMILHWLQGPYL